MRVTARVERVVQRAEEVRTPGRVWPDVGRLVVVRDDKLGDLVLTLPAVAELRKAYPDATLGLMAGPGSAALARLVPDVDEVLVSAASGPKRRACLAAFQADLVVCIARGAAGAWAAWRSGIRHRVGAGQRIFSPLFERRVDERRRRGPRHEVEYALSFAHRAGAAAGPARFPLRLPDDADLGATDLPIERPFVVLHPGSGGSCPRWPVAHYLRLALLLEAEGIPIVLSVGPEDEHVTSAAEASDDTRRLPRFQGALPSLASLLTRAALVVGSSTGPLHLAAALGTGTLAFHAPWPTCGVSRWGPYADNGWGLVADHPGAERWSHRERARGAKALMAGIEPEMALTCVNRMLEGGSPQP